MSLFSLDSYRVHLVVLCAMNSDVLTRRLDVRAGYSLPRPIVGVCGVYSIDMLTDAELGNFITRSE